MAPERGSDTREADLLARSRHGDPIAHGTLFDLHVGALRARVRRVLPRAVLRRVSVSDVVQETRILAFARVDAFASDHVSAYRAWLLRIAENKAREALRAHAGASKRAIGRERGRWTGPASLAAVARGPSPSQAAMTDELRRRVRESLEALGPADREVLRLAGLEGRPLREVAERMSRSEEAIKKLYGRALARLGKLLAPEQDAP